MSFSSGPPIGIVSDLWRYPVRSFQGSRERRLFLSPLGFLGDRRVAVLDVNREQPLTATQSPVLLAYTAVCLAPVRGADVEVEMPDGRRVRWDDPMLAADIAERTEREVRLVHAPTGLHDGPPVQIVTEASLQQMAEWTRTDVDRRRFRANVIVEADAGTPLVENDWLEHRIGMGADVVIDVIEPTRRSRVVGYDPDTLKRDIEVHATIARRLGNHFGVSGRVMRGGWVNVGDRVTIDPIPSLLSI